MPSKLKKIPKVDVVDDAATNAIFVRYFLSVGLHSERGLEYHSAAWRASFLVKFGRSPYRREAWLTVRAAIRQLIPGWVFDAMDAHFITGNAEHFTSGLDHETKQAMLAAIHKHTKQEAALLKPPEGIASDINPLD